MCSMSWCILSLLKRMSKTKDISVGMFRASILCIPILLIIIAALIPLYIYLYGVMNLFFAAQKIVFRWWLFLPIVIVCIFLHEVIHAIVFGILGDEGFKYVRIGIQWDTITPYAHYSKPIRALYYRIALLAPALILGALPIAVGLLFHQGILFIFGLLFLLFSGGDLLILWLIRKVPNKNYVKDHPTRAGCYVYED